ARIEAERVRQEEARRAAEEARRREEEARRQSEQRAREVEARRRAAAERAVRLHGVDELPVVLERQALGRPHAGTGDDRRQCDGKESDNHRREPPRLPGQPVVRVAVRSHARPVPA
ncbi:MAG: hypothetical protein ACK55I_23940, partial [bacterium]